MSNSLKEESKFEIIVWAIIVFAGLCTFVIGVTWFFGEDKKHEPLSLVVGGASTVLIAMFKRGKSGAILLGVLILGMSVMGAIFYFSSSKPKSPDPTPTPTVSPTPTPPTPSPTPTPMPMTPSPIPPQPPTINNFTFFDPQCSKNNGITCSFRIKNNIEQTRNLQLTGSIFSAALDQDGMKLTTTKVELSGDADIYDVNANIPHNLENGTVGKIYCQAQSNVTKISELKLRFTENGKDFNVVFKDIPLN